jgi:hypothetical protein
MEQCLQTIQTVPLEPLGKVSGGLEVVSAQSSAGLLKKGCELIEGG